MSITSLPGRFTSIPVYRYLYSTLMLILYPLILYFRNIQNDSVTRIIIPVFVIIIVINVFITNAETKSKQNTILITAFILILIGDLIINLSSQKKFSIIPFSLAHILMSLYYVIEGKIKFNNILSAIPVITVSGIFLLYNMSATPKQLIPVLAVYLAILSIMLWSAICCLNNKTIHPYKRTFILTGSLLFYITDLLVCLMQIYKEDSFIFLIWLFYPPSLYFLSIFNWYAPITHRDHTAA